MKTPLGLGGSELDPLDLCDVLEAIARRDASAAWTTMVANGSTGTMAGWLSDAGIAATFTDPARPPIFAGQLSPRGLAEPVEGGYRVTGRWSFSSGIRHADFVIGGCTQLGDPDAHRFVCVPVAEAKVHDTWHVAGLQGTGSDDFSLEGHFVPEALTFDWATVTARQGPDVLLANRPSFQRELGRGAARLAAARALYREVVAESFAYGLEDRPAPAGAVERILGAHTFVVDVCAEVAWELFRFGGGRALSLSNGLQRHLRNLVAARQHVYVSDENYEQAGQALLSNGAPAAG
jgi:alkylation response protein AidB-like acyl-CoA dehydrogenase